VMYASLRHYGNLITQVGQPDTKASMGRRKYSRKIQQTLSTYIDLIRPWQTP